MARTFWCPVAAWWCTSTPSTSRSSAAESTGHGSPLPQLKHGGPGRAGGGEELVASYDILTLVVKREA